MTRLLLLVPAAVAAWALWLGEVMIINGEKLSPFTWSAVSIAVLMASITSVVLTGRAPWRPRLAFIASNVCLILGAFVIARGALFQFFAGGFGPMRVANPGDLLLVVLAGVAVCGGVTITAHRWLVPVTGWTFPLVATVLVGVLPLSVASVAILPEIDPDSADFRAIAFGNTDYWLIHAVRVGYPVFWTTLLLPLAVRLGRRSEDRP